MIALPPAPFLYPIVSDSNSDDLRQDAMHALRAGVKILQLRAKNKTKKQFHALADDVSRMCSDNGVILIVNDCVDVAMVTGACGVHLGQEDFPAAEARRLLPQKIIGLSTHNAEQLAVANRLPVDYIAIGPIHGTATKPDAELPLGPQFVEKARQLTDKPLVCIGGINMNHFRSLFAAGADGIALISSLYQPPGFYETVVQMLHALEQYRAEIGR